ncbi:MAG: DegT/DnrJ/EryC1/StrS family aminotransferase [Candidatus Hydrogenedentes bacterium]|nr:DegT/DnrJ/EryC1/StrS family aminotransferase [Candidatus Hydrogenedentota bacterium]
MPKTTKNALAIHGGTPVRGADKKWPGWPQFDDTERKALNEVLESGKWFFGDRVTQFEREYADYQDARFCVTCNSGTAAAEIAMQALGIGPGDEVLVPAYTFIATASSVARVGATPIFVDIDDSWCMDPALAEAAITPRTKAIMPVHFGSQVCDMDRFNALAQKHNLKIIEDACHSWGSKWKGKGTGALGFGGVFSFQASKNITAGEGGAILTDNEEFADACKSITNCGRAKGSVWYGHVLLGTNARITEFAAALLSAQLSRLQEHTLRRQRNAAILNKELGAIEGLIPQPGDSRMTQRAYHLYCMRMDDKAFGCSREQMVEAARAEGLPIGPGYAVPLYKQPVFAERKGTPDYTKCHCPATEDLCYRTGTWFGHPNLLGSEEDMYDIVAIFKKIKENVSLLAK